jgi:hypothetical protein
MTGPSDGRMKILRAWSSFAMPRGMGDPWRDGRLYFGVPWDGHFNGEIYIYRYIYRYIYIDICNIYM